VTQFQIHYEEPGYEPSTVSAGRSLSVELDATRSPILFGCRTGICGTCLVEVQAGLEQLEPPGGDEQELLDVLTDNPRARLACQIDVCCPLTLKPLPQ